MQRQASVVKTVATLALVFVLSACGSIRQQLGVGRHSPDEFTVVKRAPLSLPPDYQLRAPREAGPPISRTASSRARSAVMGTGAEEAPRGDADQSFLRRLGAKGADPNIRAQIAKDNGLIALENKSAIKKLIFWKKEDDEEAPLPEDQAVVVDAPAEAQRIRDNTEEGKPLNEGDIPTIQKRKGTLDRLLEDAGL